MSATKILIIATKGLTTNLLYNGVSTYSSQIAVFFEKPESKKTIIKRRIKKIGWLKTCGQLLFLTLVQPFISAKKNRINEIISAAGLSSTSIPISRITELNSVNDKELAERIKAEKPAIILINGTRILPQTLLAEITCPIVNIHVGITPKYRGLHGGFWALKEGNPDLFGVTLHYVDKGIDTGSIIAQKVLTPLPTDNYKTYPILQYSAGVELLQNHLEKIIIQNTLPVEPLSSKSKLHYHPTLWEYFFR